MKHFLLISLFFITCGKLVFATNGTAEPAYHAKKIYVAPVIDGIPGEACWDSATWAPIDQIWIGTATTANDYTGAYKVLWTPERLYILMKYTRSVINDNYKGMCESDIYNYDCAEVFIDENHSGGYYLNTYKAFAYHLMTSNHACAIGPSGSESHDADMTFKFDSAGSNIYYWEIELKVFADTYVYGGSNIPVTLTGGKQIGFSVAYNTNDGGTARKNMFGSHYIADPAHRNDSYKDASYLGDLFLDADSSVSPSSIHQKIFKDEFRCYPNPVKNEINIYLENRRLGLLKIQIFDILGKEIMKFDLDKNQAILNRKINLSDLPKGIYIMKVVDGQKQYINKISLK